MMKQQVQAHIAPGNAVIFSVLFEPAIEYLKSLPLFVVWECPSLLKIGSSNTDTEVGGYMAPFNKKRNAWLHWQVQNCTRRRFRFLTSTRNSHQHQALPLAEHKSSQPLMMTPPLWMSSPHKSLSHKINETFSTCKVCLQKSFAWQRFAISCVGTRQNK